ncbi:MAG TPA: alpha/beta fold hydrolase [Acidimicrobiales bacterium]
MGEIALVTLVVADYDEALAHYLGTLGFELVEDTPLGGPPGGKRWVVVRPPGGAGAALLLARAATPEQRARVGDQTGGRVALFLRTDDFAADHARLAAAGVAFVEAPRHEPYGTVAVFEDLYGNRWDLVEYRADRPARDTRPDAGEGEEGSVVDEVQRVPYDEMSMFRENAEEFGIPWRGQPAVRREAVDLGDGRRLSALVWGTAPPEIVLLHGGAQNAHTWDTVALALDRPLVAVDLPGHGHSDGGRNGSLDVPANADDVARAVEALAPDAAAVVGMSLGGITTLALARAHPSLVRSVVLVDITPGVTAAKAGAITSFIAGPESFASFDEILARTITFNPTRSEASLRRGILHNAEQREDGSWVWRYARFRPRAGEGEGEGGGAADATPGHPDFHDWWAAVAELTVPLLLVRGTTAQSVVDDADEAELLRHQPSARVERVEGAGHSVQGDRPVELARLIDDFVPRPT